MHPDIDRMCRQVADSRKYRALDAATIRRVCEQMAERYPKHADALHAARRELHRIHAAFLPPDSHEGARALVEAADPSTLMADRELSRRLLALHASTAERLPYVEPAYQFISACIRPDDRLMDLGCGFSPFAAPFFSVEPAEYLAFDINRSTVDLLTQYFAKLKKPRWQAYVMDVAVTPPPACDVVLMLKLLPLLEQQRKGLSYALLDSLKAREAVVSFPALSLTGRQHGMAAHYAAFLPSVLPKRWRVTREERIGNELLYGLSNADVD